MSNTVQVKKYNKFSRTFGMAFGASGLACLATGAIVGLLTGVGGFEASFTFLCLGISFASVGGISLLIAHINKNKITRLVNSGKCYNAEITRVYYNYAMKINRQHPIIFECIYENSEGKTCLVKSGNICKNEFFPHIVDLPSIEKGDINARVWVNHKNPKDYFVEIFASPSIEEDEKNIKIDYDYR